MGNWWEWTIGQVSHERNCPYEMLKENERDDVSSGGISLKVEDIVEIDL